ncbi:MAG: hypothetical protein AVO33_04225 [delta proteobacterium ML8_F1]|nr:MAG: hypothetical protein AVO33_04225 [delta proteobacterium ML8_F1]
MKKILLVNALQINEEDDGMGKYARSVVEFLENHFTDKVTVCYLLTNSGKNVLKHRIPPERIVPFDYDKSRGFFIRFVKENLEIPLLRHRLRADFYWSLDGKLPLYKGKATKEIITLHDLGYMVAPGHYRLSRRLYWQLIYRTTAPRSDAVIAISDFTKRQAVEYLRLEADKVIRLSPLVRGNFVKPELPPEPGAQNYVLYYGQLTSRKNIKGLVEAYGIYSQSTTHPLKLFLVGADKSPAYVAGIKKSLVESGMAESQIVFIGYASDEELRQYIHNCRFVINPSFYEGFGLQVIEAFQMEKMILVSRNTPMVEMIDQPDRYTFEAGDSRSIAAKIIEFGKLDPEALYREYLMESRKYRIEIAGENITKAYLEALEEIMEIR